MSDQLIRERDFFDNLSSTQQPFVIQLCLLKDDLSQLLWFEQNYKMQVQLRLYKSLNLAQNLNKICKRLLFVQILNLCVLFPLTTSNQRTSKIFIRNKFNAQY